MQLATFQSKERYKAEIELEKSLGFFAVQKKGARNHVLIALLVPKKGGKVLQGCREAIIFEVQQKDPKYNEIKYEIKVQ